MVRADPGRLPAVALIDNYWAPTLAFASSLGRRAVPLAVYGSGGASWSRYCTRRDACPPLADTDRFIPWLQMHVRSGSISRVAPTTDLLAYYLSLLRDDFPPEIRATIPALAEIETCLIKTRFAAACLQLGQPVPEFAAPAELGSAVEAAARLGYPVFLKPKSHLAIGTSERGCLVRNEGELRAAFHPYPVAPGQHSIAARYPELRWPMLQRFVQSARERVFSVSGFKHPTAGIVAALVSYKSKQWPPTVGISIVQRSCENAQVLRQGLATVDSLMASGLFEIELLSDKAGLLAIDLNPRAFGFIKLDIAAGSDLPWLWYQATRQVPATPPTSPPRDDLECRFVLPYLTARAAQWAVGLGQRRARSLAQSTAPSKAWISMLGDWGDPAPMLISNLKLLRHPGSLVRPFIAEGKSLRKDHGPQGR